MYVRKFDSQAFFLYQSCSLTTLLITKFQEA